MLEYLQAINSQGVSPFRTSPIVPFSDPNAIYGYCDSVINHELVTDIFNEFSERTRRKESESYLKTLSGERQTH
jgi:hypothetical protein